MYKLKAFNLHPGGLLLALSLLCVSPGTLAINKQDAEHDIRVIIDVSGSMKQNDPANLRVPAMKLLVGLLPVDTYAGIWTFGKYVNMIVSPDLVSKDWKKRATNATSKIHSRGLFTDIEQAITKATWDWTSPAENTQRSIILLTDGVVDVSKVSAESDASRDRILTTVIPRMQEAGAVIHTIALSENADLELMQLMSVSTDGWQETAKNADQLQRIFLRMFEKSIKPDTVPLENNRFTVDGSISELTVLAFTRDEKQPIGLIAPDKKEYSASAHPGNIRWQDNTGYAMITIEKPQPGVWQLVADVDPDNRVMIVTDLKLEVGKLPNNLLTGERLDYTASLTEKGGVITRRDFLDLVTLQLTSRAQDAEPQATALSAAEETGIYSSSLQDELGTGHFELITTVESPTFKREQRHSIQVHASPVEISVNEDLVTASATINLQAIPDLVDAESLYFSGLILAPDRSTSIAQIINLEPGLWQLQLSELPAGIHQINLSVSGKTDQGREFDLQLPVVKLGKEVIPEPEPEVETPATEAMESPAVEVDMMKNMLVVGAVNIILLIPASIAFFLWRRRRKAYLQGGAVA